MQMYRFMMSLLHGTSDLSRLVLYWVLIGVACKAHHSAGCGTLKKLVTGQGASI
jgi:hypothetical protein